MKYLLKIIFMLIMASSVTSCSDLNLRMMVSQLNAKCPIESRQMTYNSFSLEDNELVMKCTITDNSFASITSNSTDWAKDFAKLFLVGAKQKNDGFLNKLIDSNVNVRIEITDPFSSKTYTGVYTTEDIKEILEAPEHNPEDALLSVLEVVNKMFPVQLDEGSSIEKAELEADAIMLVCSLSDEEFDDCAKEDKDRLLEACLVSFRSSSGDQFFKMLIDAKKGFGVRLESKGNGRVISHKMDYETLDKFINGM